MIKVESIFKKENLTAAAGLGAGSLAAEVVVGKAGPLLTKEGEELNETVAKAITAIPILAGLLLATSTGFMKNLGHGMLAQGVSGVGKSYIPLETKEKLGIGQDVMLGNAPMMDADMPDTAPMAGVDYTNRQDPEMKY
jgi:hypothetical protein